MDNWLAIVVITIAAVLLIGNFSTFHKSSKTPLRKKNLSDLTETLPRTHKKKHKLPPVYNRDKKSD